METNLSEEIDCLLCKETFVPVIEPEEGQSSYPIYCSSCAIRIPMKAGNPVRVTFRDALGLRGNALAQAVEEALMDCPCGGKFSHDAGRRCPSCIEKIASASRGGPPAKTPGIWNLEKLQMSGDKIFAYMMGKLDAREESLARLIERFEAGEIDTEQYMEGIENIRRRDFIQICAIQTWAMIQGPQTAFRAAEELDLVERYGTRVLVSIASALEMSTGRSILTTLSGEVENWEGAVQKELKMFIAKTAGG